MAAACSGAGPEGDDDGNAVHDAVATDETVGLIPADKVEGTAVDDREGKSWIDRRPMITVFRAAIDAVMSFGGFLGIGDRYHPLPWSVLTTTTRPRAAMSSIWVAICSKAHRAMAPARCPTGPT